MVVDVVVALSVRDMVERDLASCSWSGGALHVQQLAQQLDRAQRGQVEFLAVCPPSDVPVAIGGVDYEVQSGAGTLWQLVVHEALRSCGIGTALVGAAEQRILARGCVALNWASRRSTRGRAPCTSGSATSATAASRTDGTLPARTARSRVTRRRAR